MLKTIKNPDAEKYREVTLAVIDNDGYCPCLIPRNEDTFCMCKEFREKKTEGYCHCLRFKKVLEKDDDVEQAR